LLISEVCVGAPAEAMASAQGEQMGWSWPSSALGCDAAIVGNRTYRVAVRQAFLDRQLSGVEDEWWRGWPIGEPDP